MFTKFHYYLLSFVMLLVVTISCDKKTDQQKGHSSSSDAVPSTKATANKKEAERDSMTKPHYKRVGEFKIEYGYLHYDEDQFGFSNPGYLRAFKGNQLVFEDSFKGEGPVDVETLGYQELEGQKLVFRLNHGTAACDYTTKSRYYVAISTKIYFLKEYYGGTGGDLYATRFYKHIFPKDTAGVANSILIVEGIQFNEHDQPDLFDTTYVKFANNRFTISKPTNNLDKAK